MKITKQLTVMATAVAVALISGCGRSSEDGEAVLHVYNWSDYMAEGLIERF